MLVLLAAASIILPIALLVVWCIVNRWPWPEIIPTELTLRGLQRLFTGYSNTAQALIFSILFSLMIGIISTIIATMTARALTQYDFVGKKLVETLAFLPLVVPATVFAFGSHMLFLRMGLGNTAFAVALSHIIYTLPFSVRIMLDVTKASSDRYEQQARVLGAPPAAAFIHGTLPIITPGIISSLAVSFLISYTQYFLTVMLGGGKVKTLAIIVMPLITGSDRTISSAYSVMYILSTLLVFLLFQRISAIMSKRVGAQLAR